MLYIHSPRARARANHPSGVRVPDVYVYFSRFGVRDREISRGPRRGKQTHRMPLTGCISRHSAPRAFFFFLAFSFFRTHTHGPESRFLTFSSASGKFADNRVTCWYCSALASSSSHHHGGGRVAALPGKIRQNNRNAHLRRNRVLCLDARAGQCTTTTAEHRAPRVRASEEQLLLRIFGAARPGSLAQLLGAPPSLSLPDRFFRAPRALPSLPFALFSSLSRTLALGDPPPLCRRLVYRRIPEKLERDGCMWLCAPCAGEKRKPSHRIGWQCERERRRW